MLKSPSGEPIESDPHSMSEGENSPSNADGFVAVLGAEALPGGRDGACDVGQFCQKPFHTGWQATEVNSTL